MVRYSMSITRCVAHQCLIIILIFILLSAPGSADENKYFNLRLDICYPGQIPNFIDFETPTIVPGSTEELKFSIQNRYTFHNNNNMSNVTLTVNIYDYTTLESHKKIQDVSNAPKITGGNSALQTITDKWTAVFYWANIQFNETVPIEVSIKSKTDTPEGRYFVRMQLNFWFNDSRFEMRSRGYFSDTTWDKATMNISDQEGYIGIELIAGQLTADRLIAGRLDLIELGVDGIVPETSIRVLTPIPVWPLYILVGFAVLFILLAIIFYFMDEKGKFPHTKKKLDRLGEKINDIRYRRK